ncbi:MAG: hypothetical protein AAF420_14015, partial [Pseudomonadota bacterium]
DSAVYTHNIGVAPEDIVVRQRGDYLLVYNDAFVSGVQRATPKVRVEVNGVRVPGADTKAHYIRNQQGHAQASGSLVFMLNNLASDSTVRVSVVRDISVGLVDDSEDGLLTLWQKARQEQILVPAVTNVTATSADVSVDFFGEDSAYELTLFWGPVDGGTNPVSWANTVPIGTFTNQALTNIVEALTTLSGGVQYFFSWRASNCASIVWSDTPRDFFTAIAPMINNQTGAAPAIGSAVLNGTLVQGEPADACSNVKFDCVPVRRMLSASERVANISGASSTVMGRKLTFVPSRVGLSNIVFEL